MTARNAFIYDFLLVEGGAEALSLHVIDRFREFELVAGFIDGKQFPASALPQGRYRSLTSATRKRGWQGLKTMAAFDHRGKFLVGYDTAVFSGVYAPVGVVHRGGDRNLYYCHTPPRFAYDLESHYQAEALQWQRPLLRRLAAHVRRRYETAIRCMDRIAVNSENVARRLRDHLGVDHSEIIHPPVDTANYHWIDDEGYFLSTARLEPYKRVDRLVDAFSQMPGKKLVIASGGSQETELRSRAAGLDNIRFTGWQSKAALRELVGRCRATLYLPRDEDFGMSPVESMAAGKPVIGVAEGGLLETVADGRTGILIPPANLETGESATEAIINAVQVMSRETARAMQAECEQRAQRFNVATFDEAFARFVAP